MTIEWDRLGQPQFDRVIGALMHRLYANTDEINIVDGRGGDGGRDITVVQGSRLRIFQMKYFPDGFPGSVKGRRSQIKRSFKTAMKHDPYEWTLVVPCVLTPTERSFVEGLGAGYEIKISVMDRAELDSRIAMFPDLEASFTRNQLADLAKIFSQEKAMLHDGPGDLQDRVRALGRVVDGCDDDWTFDFTRSGDTTICTLRAKHPRAPEVSPIHIELEASFGPDQGALAKTARRTLGFGTAEGITLPPEVVTSWQVVGPAWLSETASNIEVIWVPAVQPPSVATSIEVRFLDEDGRMLASHEGVLWHCGAGSEGRSLQARFHGVLNLDLFFPFEKSAAGTLNCHFELTGADPATALRVLALNRELHRCEQLQVFVEEHRLGTFHFNRPAYPTRDLQIVMGLDLLEALAYDLDVVQRHCGVHFAIPDTVTKRERIMLRFARLLIEGHCVIHPDARVLTITLNGTYSPELRQLLSGEPQGIKIEELDYQFTFGGRELRLGRVALFNMQVVAEDHEHLLRALDTGTATDLQACLKPTEGHYFRAYMPDKGTNPNEQLVPTPWNLAGIGEPEDSAT